MRCRPPSAAARLSSTQLPVAPAAGPLAATTPARPAAPEKRPPRTGGSNRAVSRSRRSDWTPSVIRSPAGVDASCGPRAATLIRQRFAESVTADVRFPVGRRDAAKRREVSYVSPMEPRETVDRCPGCDESIGPGQRFLPGLRDEPRRRRQPDGHRPAPRRPAVGIAVAPGLGGAARRASPPSASRPARCSSTAIASSARSAAAAWARSSGPTT